MVQIMPGELSEISYSCLGGRVGCRNPMNKRMRKGGLKKARCKVSRIVAKGVMFLIHLQRNALSMYLREKHRHLLEHRDELVLGYLVHVPHQEIRMQDSIAGVSLIKERPVRKMEGTDSQWLGVIVYNALISRVDVVQILHYTRLSFTPAWWRYIFPLVVGGSGWDLKRETD
jgi:hypothetical protein